METQKLNETIIHVILLMKKGMSHVEAFKEMADNLGITINAVRDSCVRRIGFVGKGGTNKFSDLVRNNGIKNYLKRQYPDDSTLLDKELSY